MTQNVEQAALGRIAEQVGRRIGIILGRAQTDLARAAAAVIERVGLRDVTELESRLASGRLWDELIDQITVRETYFFRNPEHFDLIRDTILPELERARPEGCQLRIWSAGCASGEEAYSLAILLRERGLDDAHVLGTDISQSALLAARAGRYREWSFRAIEPGLLPRHFRQEQKEYVVRDEVRARVTFTALNLLEPDAEEATAIGPFDLILCRNVMIYFDSDGIERLERRLFDALALGGWLLTGPSDPLLGHHTPLDVVTLPMGVCYRKRHAMLPEPAPRPLLELPPLESPRPHAATPAAMPREDRDIESVRARARAAFDGAEYGRAITIARSRPEDAELAVLEVRSTWNRQDAIAAEQCCAHLLRRHALSAELQYLHAMTLLECHRLPDALRAVRSALYLDRNLPIAHFAHGAILERLNDLEGARRAYRNTYDACTKREPDEALTLGDGIVAQGLSNAAAHALKELARRCPA